MRAALVVLLALASCGPPAGGRTVAARPAEPPRPGTYDQHDLLVEPVDVYGSGVWFASELVPLADAIAAAFTARPAEGFRPIPPGDLRALYQGAREGRLPGKSSVCAAASPPALLAETVYAGASTAESRVHCNEQGCRLEVIVSGNERSGPVDEKPELARFALALPKGGSPTTWSDAIRTQGLARVPPPEGDDYGVGGIAWGGSQPGTYAIVDSLEQTGVWPTPLSSAVLTPHAEALHACSVSAPAARDWWLQPYVVEVGADGHIARCEDSLPHRLPEPGMSCRCAVLRGIEFGAASPGRRARFTLHTVRVVPNKPDVFSRSLHLTQMTADDSSAILGRGNLDEVRANGCLRAVLQPIGSHAIPVLFSVGADGRVLSHQLAWPAAVDASLRACLDGVLRAAQFDCPLSGHANVRTTLSVEVDDGKGSKPIKASP